MGSTSEPNGARRTEFDARCTAWLRGMAEGSEPDLEAFYEATLGKVYGLALRIMRAAPAAEDVVAEVYFQAWNEAARYDARRGRPITWLLTICRSRALDQLRRQAVSARADDESAVMEEAATEVGPDTLLQAVEQERQVHSLLEKLAPIQRHLLALAYFRDLSHQQIADYMQLPLGTVKTHIRKALKELQQSLVERQLTA